MKPGILILAFLITWSSGNSQSSLIEDSVLLETCRSIANNKSTDDSLKVAAAFDEHLSPLFMNLTDSLASVTYDYVLIRLQKLCPEFKRYLSGVIPLPNKNDWVFVENAPDSKLDKKSSRDFLTYHHYYYFDQNGDTIHLSLSNEHWIDHFKDGTYSKLKFAWTGDTEFEISFIESNNQIRNSLSKPGEKYTYELIEKFAKYYLVFLNMPQLKVLGTFKIYYE